MNYKKIYDNFIKNRQTKKYDDISMFEIHHILPKSLGGDNSSLNLIKLSVSDHIFAHELLARIYGDPMWYAIWQMTQTRKVSNKHNRFLLEMAKKNRSELMSKRMKNRIVSEETKQKLRDTAASRTDTENRIVGRNISIAKKLKKFKHSQDTKDKIRETKTGSKLSEEHKNKISKSTIGIKKKQKQLTCPHCSKITNQSMSTMHHFDNCKFKNITYSEYLKIRRKPAGEKWHYEQFNFDISYNEYLNELKEIKRINSKRTDETKKKISQSMLGRKCTWNKKMSIASKKVEKITCPHCKMEGTPANMKRWHFDNCKNMINTLRT